MKLSLTLLTASILLVGAACNSTTNTSTSVDTTPTENTAPETVVDLEASSTTTIQIPENNKPTACTMDAKACPDGSYVGRTGPNCEFAACPTVKTEEKPTVEATKPTGPATYTMADVQAKAAAGQCWSVISGKVYDLTSWITKHPGGQAAIKSLCGIDGTAKFQAMHGGQAKAEKALTSYFVGSLK